MTTAATRAATITATYTTTPGIRRGSHASAARARRPPRAAACRPYPERSSSRVDSGDALWKWTAAKPREENERRSIGEAEYRASVRRSKFRVSFKKHEMIHVRGYDGLVVARPDLRHHFRDRADQRSA